MNIERLRPINILLVEDNPGDVRLVREGLKESKVSNEMAVATDGEEATLYLKRQGKYAGVPLPDLILLDLNLPKKNGKEVLADIKSDPELRSIPVIVLTSSQAAQDVAQSYDNHVNCYIVKPVGFDEFLKIVNNIRDFWFMIVKLPGNGEA